MSGGACVIIVDTKSIAATTESIGSLVADGKIKKKSTVKAGVSCLKNVKKELDEFLELVEGDDE